VAVGFAPGALRFEVRLWLADAERVPAARSQLVVAVAESLRAAGIELEPGAG
jgi:small-conductance mechanosensitive channel